VKPGKVRLAVAGAGCAALALAFLPNAAPVGAVPPAAPAAQGAGAPNMYELHQLPGTVIGEGQNVQPAGQHQVATYRVEELALPSPVAVTIAGQAVTVGRAWRVAVIGGPFPVRALPPVLWIDGVMLGIGHENEDLTEISTIVFDRSLLRDGGTLALSFGFSAQHLSEVPEKLVVGG
jgi:hypothetical protein